MDYTKEYVTLPQNIYMTRKKNKRIFRTLCTRLTISLIHCLIGDALFSIFILITTCTTINIYCINYSRISCCTNDYAAISITNSIKLNSPCVFLIKSNHDTLTRINLYLFKKIVYMRYVPSHESF